MKKTISVEVSKKRDWAGLFVFTARARYDRGSVWCHGDSRKYACERLKLCYGKSFKYRIGRTLNLSK